MTPDLSTVADVLPRMAAVQPNTTAIFFPTKRRDEAGEVIYTDVSYRELDERSSRIAAGLHAVGIERGHRAALMVRPSPELFALTFGMFKAGVVPVMIDPGLGIQGLGNCLARAKPSAFIGIPVAHAARIALGWGRATVERTVTVGGWGLAKHTLAGVEALGAERLAAGDRPLPTGGNEVAALLFTSGSTGPPKGAVYRHRNFLAQVKAIREMFSIEPGEIDLPTFPLFALFD
ncbi:MAG: AMP-binding protein, partial [Myxococcales bacterium]|nr:AMP-binding protein [Myxococcales bacterium]